MKNTLALPHLEGRTIVDGDRRIKLDSARASLLGRSGNAYVVSVTAGDYPRVLRVARDGSTRTLVTGIAAYEVTLSGDGNQLGSTRTSYAGRSTLLRVYDARRGRLQITRDFSGSLSVLDFNENRMVLGGFGPNRTFWWNTHSNAMKRVNGRAGYSASIGGDRVASYTRDPYRGGCSVVSRLSDPSVELWRSCKERVDAFAPNGQRLASIALLSDGIGPSWVTVRRIRGHALATYTASWFGELRWENNHDLLLDTNGRKRSATVRCDQQDCDRASALRPVPEL